MKNCQKCGASIADATKFCPQCGSETHEFCPHCGKDVIPGRQFCTFCGGKLPNKTSAFSFTPTGTTAVAGSNSTRDTMYLTAGILNFVILALALLGTGGFAFLACLWVIPIGLAIFKARNDQNKHTTLAIVSIFFAGVIPGILILIADNM